VKWRSWRKWRNVCVEVQLQAGSNTIRLDALGRRRSILDSMTILKD
jgi:hypothetical protein